MANNISGVFRVGADPELKNVGQHKVMEFSVANDTGFGDKKTTNWFRASIWGNRAESLKAHVAKGKQLFITGELTLNKYNDKNGVEKLSPNIKVSELNFISGGSSNSSDNNNTQASAPTAETSSSSNTEDLPF